MEGDVEKKAEGTEAQRQKKKIKNPRLKDVVLKIKKMTREEELAEKGWEKQITLDEPRLSDVVEMYEEIDFEVHIEPFNPDEEHGCIECMKATPDKYKTIYTREKS